MFNNIKFEKKEDLLEFFKEEITMKELKEYCNKYIAEGLQVGERYVFYGLDEKYKDIHSIITYNIKKGIAELWEKYKIDNEKINNIFKVGVWELGLYVDFDCISIFDNIGAYKFEKRTRKNASISNATFVLEELPHFEFYEDNIDNLTIKNYIVKKLNEKKEKMIEHYRKEITSWENSIRNNKNMINNLEKIDLNFVNENEITEWCDECGMESVISKNGGYCEHCGKYLLPCSLCDIDKVDCNNCKYKNN